MSNAGTVLTRSLTDSPRWLFLGTLAWAPWAYGSTRDWTLPVFNALLGAVAVLWLASLLARRSRPAVHPLLLGAALFLIAQGWFMIWNAPYFYDRTALEFVPVPSFWKSGPGALDTVDSIPMMIRITGLLVVMCFVCDLGRRPVWRQRIWATIGLVAVSLIAFGGVKFWASNWHRRMQARGVGRSRRRSRFISTAGMPQPSLTSCCHWWPASRLRHSGDSAHLWDARPGPLRFCFALQAQS
jgi:hypothetical protein